MPIERMDEGDLVALKNRGNTRLYTVEYSICPELFVLKRPKEQYDHAWKTYGEWYYDVYSKGAFEKYKPEAKPKYKIGDVLAERRGSDLSSYDTTDPDAPLTIVAEPIKALGTYYYVLRYLADGKLPFIVVERYLDKTFIKI